MIIKYVHNGKIVCVQYEDEKQFLESCYKSEFIEILFNAKDIIVLENDGTSYSCDNLLDVYQKYRSYVVERK